MCLCVRIFIAQIRARTHCRRYHYRAAAMEQQSIAGKARDAAKSLLTQHDTALSENKNKMASFTAPTMQDEVDGTMVLAALDMEVGVP